MRTFFLILTLITIHQCVGRGFSPPEGSGDEELLSQARRKLRHQVITSTQELIDQVELVRTATRAYIGAKIKENLLEALSTVAENEVETMSMQNRARQPRQEDEDEDEITATPEPGILPQLATILQSVFGPNVNVTKYVENASKLLPRPIGQQVVGLVSLLDPNQFSSTPNPSETTVLVPITPPPRIKTNSSSPAPLKSEGSNSTGIQNKNETQLATPSPRVAEVVKLSELIQITAPPKSSSTTVDSTDEEDGEASEEDFDGDSGRSLSHYRQKRQAFNLPGLHPMKLLDGIEALWKNFGKTNETTVGATKTGAAGTPATGPGSRKTIAITGKAGGSSTTESDDGFDDDYTTKPSRVNTAVKGAASQFDQLRKGVPDLFQGAREAYKFLEHLNGFLDSWENRLLAGDNDE